MDSYLIHLFYQKSNYFISTRGKRARRVHQTPKISKNFTQEKFERHLEYLSQESEPGRDSKTLWPEKSNFRCMKFYHVLTRKSCFCMRLYSQLSLMSNSRYKACELYPVNERHIWLPHIFAQKKMLGTSNMTDDLTQREMIEDFDNKSNYWLLFAKRK